MKLIMENWNKYLKENEIVEGQPRRRKKALKNQVIDIISASPYLKHLAKKVQSRGIKDTGNFYYVSFPGELRKSPHIKKHFDKNNPGSVWNISEDDVENLILRAMDTPPSKQLEFRGSQRFKWLNVPAGQQIGYDSVKKMNPNDPGISFKDELEHFGMADRVKEWGGCEEDEETGEMRCTGVNGVAIQNNYELVTCGGGFDKKTKKCTQEGEPYTEQHLANNAPAFLKQNIAMAKGNKLQNPTELYNVVAVQVGEIEGKPLLTLMTVYPGMQPLDDKGNDLMDKKQFKDHGYYFVEG